MSVDSVRARVSPIWIVFLPAVVLYATLGAWAESSKRRAGDVRVALVFPATPRPEGNEQHLPLAIETLDAPADAPPGSLPNRGAAIHVALVPNGSSWLATGFSRERTLGPGVVWIAGVVESREGRRIRIDYGIEPVPAARARFLASIGRPHEVTADLDVDHSGRARLADLHIDGVPWDEWRGSSARSR